MLTRFTHSLVVCIVLTLKQLQGLDDEILGVLNIQVNLHLIVCADTTSMRRGKLRVRTPAASSIHVNYA